MVKTESRAHCLLTPIYNFKSRVTLPTNSDLYFLSHVHFILPESKHPLFITQIGNNSPCLIFAYENFYAIFLLSLDLNRKSSGEKIKSKIPLNEIFLIFHYIGS